MSAPAPRDEFAAFLQALGLPQAEEVLAGFDRYHALLEEKNRLLNLYSRATPEGELWTKHFLDSLLPLKCIEFSGKKTLDFGSGAGFPGLPLKLAAPGCRMLLLDSVRKKARALDEIVAELGLKGCEVVCARLEELPPGAGYDLVLCRAVRLEERYLKPLRGLLAPAGRVLFYKSRELADIAPYGPELLLEEEFPWGFRRLYALGRTQLKR